MPRFVVLLRGVNVGKHKRVPMVEFRAILHELGFSGVRTLLNSGNAVFDADSGSTHEHADAIGALLFERSGVSAHVVVKTSEAWTHIMAANPMVPPEADHSRFLVAFGGTPDDVRGLTPLSALVQGRERIVITDDAAYLYCPEGIATSKLASAAAGRMGRGVTTRNWATVLKIAALIGVD